MLGGGAGFAAPGQREAEPELGVVVARAGLHDLPERLRRGAYRPASNWARPSASSTLRDPGSASAARSSSCAAAAALPRPSSSRPRWYHVYGVTDAGPDCLGRRAIFLRAGILAARGASDICADPSVRPGTSGAGPAGLALAPFRGVRYAAGPGERTRRGHLSTVRRDCGQDERPAAARADPHNVVRLILPRHGPGQPGRGLRATRPQLLRDWLAEGILVPTTSPRCTSTAAGRWTAARPRRRRAAARADRRGAAGAARGAASCCRMRT